TKEQTSFRDAGPAPPGRRVPAGPPEGRRKMKTRWWAMAALPLLAAPGITGQQNSGNATQDTAPPVRGGRLSRVTDGQEDEQGSFDREAWRKRLSANDLEERERACDELGALARHDGEARKTLQEWSKEDQDRELAWT